MLDQINNNNNDNKLTTTTTTTTTSNNNNNNEEKIKKNKKEVVEVEEEQSSDGEGSSGSGDNDEDNGGKKKKKGKKKKEKKRLRKLIEQQQLQIEKLEQEKYNQQLHINQLSNIDDMGVDTMINQPPQPQQNNNNYSYTDITDLPPPTVTNPLVSSNDINNNSNSNNDINWLTQQQQQQPPNKSSSSITSNSLLLPPPPQKVVQNIKPKKNSIYNNEIQAFGKRKTSNGSATSTTGLVDYIENENNKNSSSSNNNSNGNGNNKKNGLKNRIFGSGSNNTSDNEIPTNKAKNLSAIAAAEGKKIPVWRKVLSDDSKLFSNERTWMSWVGTTFSLGAIGTAIITFFGTESLSLFTGLCLWVIALGFLVYSYVIFRLRRKAILTKGKGPFDDPYGPIALVVMVMFSITLFLVFFIIKKPEPLAHSKSK